MGKMQDYFERIWAARASYANALLILAAFLIMVIVSCVIMSNTLNYKLSKNANEMADDAQAFVSNTLLGPEVTLNFIADAIEGMLRRGESFDNVKKYMDECSSPIFKEKIHIFNYYSVYGYFDVFDKFYDGGGFTGDENFVPKERPWYSAALAKGNAVAITKPYKDADSDTLVMAYARALRDDAGRVLGVVCLDVPLDFITQLITREHITHGAYGFLADEKMHVIIHPSEEIRGINMNENKHDVSRLASVMEQGLDISKHQVKNYQDVKALLFGRQLANGWYLGFVIPEKEYYKDLYKMIWIISLLGLTMAVLLSFLLFRIDAAKNKSDMENRQKSNFLAIMSHEIRTPMNAIMAITEMQLQENKLTQNSKEAFDRIYYSGNLLLQIINDLLDLSKIEAGKLDIVPDKYEMASLINEVVHLNKIRFDSKPIEFKLSIDENIPATLTGDSLRIKQILNNILSNAFKYTWEGEVELRITSEPVDAGDEKNVVIVFVVRDTGQGMSNDDLKNLYDEYARFNTRANRSTTGTGLGMNITKNLIDLMDGEITAESKPKKGSTFTVRLPQKLNGSNARLGKDVVENLSQFHFNSITKMPKSSILREHMPYGSVLIVDDTETNLFIAKLLLRPYGLKIETAASAFEAIERIKNKNKYDIIFMDHMMPKMDGMEGVKIIRDLGYVNPIVALTANAVSGQAEIFLKNGFDDFISKPIDMRVLNAALNKHIRDKQTPEVVEAARMEKAAMKKYYEEHLPAYFEKCPVCGSGAVEEEMGDRKSNLFSIPGLNSERGLEIFEGDAEDYMAALCSFVKNAPDVVDKIRHVTEENLSEYALNIHSLKSISSWICADSIWAKAKSLEDMAKTGDLSLILSLNNELIKETEALIDSLKARIDELN
jgi:signal transduction histidine kinase/FixJ family two-component response regulator